MTKGNGREVQEREEQLEEEAREGVSSSSSSAQGRDPLATQPEAEEPQTKEEPKGKGKSKTRDSAPNIVDLISPRRSKLSFEYSITTELDEEEDDEDDCKTEAADDERMSVASTNLSVTDPLDGLSFDPGEPEGSSTPRITRTMTMSMSMQTRSLPQAGPSSWATWGSMSMGVSTSKKRALSFSDEEDNVSITSSASYLPIKKQRLRRRSSNSSLNFKMRLRHQPLVSPCSPTTSESSFSRTYASFAESDRDVPITRGRKRQLSTTSSMSDLSHILPRASEQDNIRSEALAMMRSHSVATTRNSSPAPPPLPDSSAHYNLRASRITIDFSVSYTDGVGSLAPVTPDPTVLAVATANARPVRANDPVAALLNAHRLNNTPAQATNSATNGPLNTVARAAITEACPVSWSHENVLAFSRGNRVHLRSFAFGAGEDAMQVFKVNKSEGDLRMLAWAGRVVDGQTIAALTTRGTVQLWDVNAKARVQNWHLAGGATCLAWSGSLLAVGTPKGQVRFYDTRMKAPKIGKAPKETKSRLWQSRSPIRSLAWHVDGKLFASGDDAGRVVVWDFRKNEQMNVGDWVDGLHHTRRIQHAAPVKALAWAPWAEKLLASGDTGESGSTLRVWKINQQVDKNTSMHRETSSMLDDDIVSSLPTPYKSEHPCIRFDAPTTSVHWSELAKEILTTHGPGMIPTEPPPLINGVLAERPPSVHANAIAVHSYLTLKQVALAPAVAENAIATSAVSPNGQRIVVAVPGEKKLKIWDVWKPSLRRTSSKLSFDAKIR